MVIGVLFSSFACTPQLLFQHKDIPDLSYIAEPDQYEHVIQPDDKITLSIWGHDDLGVGSSFSVYSSTLEQGKYISVDNQGEVGLPLIGRVKLVDLTAREADLYLHKLYSKYVKNPIVYLRVLNHSVSILGEVTTPGNYILDKQRKTLLEIVGDAGGFTKYANKSSIKIIRHHSRDDIEEIEIDLTEFETLYTKSLVLHNRDIVYVPEHRSKKFEEVVGGKVVPIVGIIGSIAIILSLVKSN